MGILDDLLGGLAGQAVGGRAQQTRAPGGGAGSQVLMALLPVVLQMLSNRGSGGGSGSGGGISADRMERVFEPFFTTKGHGLGLGLAICRSIVAAHGGRLWVTNNTDGGATFSFTLLTQPAG